jgi:signal transduction histidine kinase/CheY-like chemotaxis protein
MAKVLVVDDHASNRELIVSLLKYAGHESLEAEDGSLALEQVRSERPDLVICDLLMPTMDGYEFVRQVRADPDVARTEVIFYTATFTESEALGLATSCGVSSVLVKPCEPEVILSAIEHALAHASADKLQTDGDRFDREHLRLLTDKLTLKVNELESVNLRMSTLIDLNLQLASERDPHVLLDKVCRGARDLLGARYAVLAVRDRIAGDSTHLFTWGLATDQADRLKRQLLIGSGVCGQVMADGHPRRFVNPDGNPLGAGLSADYPPVQTGLIAPIVSLHHTYGWILLIDKLGADTFSEQDERMLAIHAAQAGRIYENGSLYMQVKRTAEQLQIEVVERKRTARELLVVNDTLEQRVVSRTAELRDMIDGLESFNRSVSHDLRGPLGGIAGAAHLARDFVAAKDHAKVDRFLQAIAVQAETTGKMVDALLTLARTGDVTLTRRTVDTTALVRDVLEAMRQAGPGEPLPVVVGTLPDVDADPQLARQVFVNLIGNALKFASRVPQTQVEVGATGTPPLFFVRDNGVGFDPEKAQRLFKPFQRLHEARFEGSGIGLSIVKRIIDRHGGKVWAESAPAQGATFFFSFGSETESATPSSSSA